MVPELVSVLLATDADWLYDDVDAALADESTTVHRVRSGRVVVPTVREIDPQLVVLDLQIGNVGGVATALALRQEEDMGRLTRRPILMLLDREADVFMAQMARADGWLVKPINSVRLRRAATSVLGDEGYFEGMLEPTS